jgi:hypothetical protein
MSCTVNCSRPGSPQGGEAVCKTAAFSMVGSIPTPGTDLLVYIGGYVMKFLKNKNRKPYIRYIAKDSSLVGIDSVRPQPLTNFIPEWWKSIPSSDLNRKTVKNCPAFMDIFSSAYVVPMWCDTKITVDDEKNIYWQTPNKEYFHDVHNYDQFLKYSPEWIKNSVNGVFKPTSPWLTKTSPGYSVYQMPVFYNFNKNFTSLPGILHTDVYHIINPQILIHTDKESFMIKRGEPLFIHFPFKRDKFDLLVEESEKDFKNYLHRSNAMIATKFIGGYRLATKGFIR